MRIGSDFSGVGAFEQALIRLGLDYTNVFACDMDKYVRETYIANYGEPDYYPKDVYERDIPEEPLDIYMTSPPCQAFSIAGKRGGEGDKRGVLFYNSHEFIIKNRPRYFIFENVKGLLSDDDGKTFQRWIDYLAKSVNGNPMIFPHEDSAGYHVYHMVLNTKDYGVPQNRERIFIVGIRDDKDNSFRFPKTQHLTKRLKDILEETVKNKYFIKLNKGENIINKINGNVIKILNGGRWDKMNEQNRRIYNTNHEAPTIHTMQGGHREPKILMKTNKSLRKLTPRECFRLQDFPDTFKMPCSDSQMYKQAGNSITVGVLYNILKNLI